MKSLFIIEGTRKAALNTDIELYCNLSKCFETLILLFTEHWGCDAKTLYTPTIFRRFRNEAQSQVN